MKNIKNLLIVGICGYFSLLFVTPAFATWWNSGNTTYGFVYLTNKTYSDTFEYYNASYNFTENWNIIGGNWILNQSDNGFGHNTTWISSHNNTDSASINFSDFNYNNFEVIVKVNQNADYGSDRCRVKLLGTTGNYLFMQFRLGEIYYRKDTGDAISTGINYTQGKPVLFKFIVNQSWHEYYFSKDMGETWQLAINFTSSNPPDGIYFEVLEAGCSFDQFIIREKPFENFLNETMRLAPSFIYDDSEGDTWLNATIYWYRDNVLRRTITFNNPNDFDNFKQNWGLPGTFYINVSICGADKNCSWNLSENTPRFANSYFDDCSDYPNVSFTMNIYDEEDPDSLLNAYVEIEGASPYMSEILGLFNYEFNGSNTYDICIAFPDLVVNEDLYIKYTTEDGFTHRYYVVNGSFSVDPQEFNMYNFANTTGISDLKITIRNKNTYQYMENIIAKLQRNYIGEGVWRTIQMDQTGDFGLAFFNIKEEDTDYKLIFMDRDNNILDTSESMKFVCTSGLCEITFVLEPYSGGLSLPDPIFDINYDNTTGIIYVVWSDPSGENAKVNSIVTKETSTGTLTICSNETTGASGSHQCNIAGHIGLILVRARYSRSPISDAISEWFDVKALPLSVIIGTKESALYSFGIMLTIAGFGIILGPVASIIGMVLGFIIIHFLGMFSPLNMTFIIIGCILGIAIGIKLRH